MLCAVIIYPIMSDRRLTFNIHICKTCCTSDPNRVLEFRHNHWIFFLRYFRIELATITSLGWIDSKAISEATCRGSITPWFRPLFVCFKLFPT